MHDNALSLSSSLTSAMSQLTETCIRDPAVTNSWYGSSLSAIIRKRDNAYKIFKRTLNADDWQRCQLFRNIYVRAIRSAKNNVVQEELARCSGNSKRLWKRLKELIKPGSVSNDDIKFDGNGSPCSNVETAERLNMFFIQSVEAIHDSIPPPSQISTVLVAAERASVDTEFCQFQPITMSQLIKIVTSLKPCSGVNNVTKRVLIDALDVVGNKFLNIINMSLRQGVVPAEWKESTVIPIPKMANSTRAEDRRPINMLPIYEKILEMVVKEQLSAYIEHAEILVDEQSGFRKQHSCESALNLLLLKWKQAIEQKKIVLAVFVDLKS